MLRFLRRYSKYILAVFGTLLLITFLIPFAFTQLLQGVGRGRTVWATMHGDKIRARELWDVQRELQVLQFVVTQLPEELDRAEYWYLLVREANDAGLIGSPLALTTPGLDETQITNIAAASGESISFVRSTLAKWEGVGRLMNLYLDGDKYSDRRLKHKAQRLYHRVAVQPLVIPTTLPDTPGSYADDELQAQLDKYAEDLPGEGEMGFGYKLPHRAKVEWLVIPADAVREAVERSDEAGPVAQRKHWLRNTNRFDEPPGPGTVPDEVKNDLIDQLTAQMLDRIERDAADRLRFARRGLERRSGYAVLPDGWQGLALEDLAIALQQDYDIELPAYLAVGDRWLSAVDMVDLPEIGIATSDKFGRSMALGELVMAARELEGSATVPIQQGIAGPPLRGADNSIFLFRITDTDPSRAPESLDEVRDLVIADMDRLARYEKLVDAADGIRELAVNEGLLSVAMLYDTPVQRATSVTLGFPANFPGIGPSEEASEAIVDHATALPQDRDVADLPTAERIVVVPVQDALSLLVARIDSQTPLTQETFQSYLQFGIIQQSLLADEITEENPIAGAFGYEALARRHDFKLSGVGDAQLEDGDVEEDVEDDAQAGLN